MDKCQHCTLKNSDKPCFVQLENCTFQCDLINPDHPNYNPGHVQSHKQFNGIAEETTPAPSFNPREVKKLPSAIQMAGNFMSSALNHIAHGMKTITEEEQKARMDICKKCDFFKDGDDPRCFKCGCPLKTKTSWAYEKCPIGLWSSQDSATITVQQPCLPCNQ